MKLFRYIGLSIENLKLNRLRSFFTSLGIIIGIFNLTLVLAILQSGRKMILGEISGLGANVINIYSMYPMSEREQFLIKKTPSVVGVFPDVYLSTQIKLGKNMKDVWVQGVSSDFERIFKIEVNKGRFIKESDLEKKKKVCVITESLSKELFKEASCLGKDIILENERLKIVGLSKEKMVLSKMMGGFLIFAPISVVQRMNQTEDITGLNVILKDSKSVKEVSEKLDKLLNKGHLEEKRFWISSMQEMIESTKKITGIIALIVGAIAGISLLVGGIGIMNIMLVSVRERTREIGIRKAFGATNKDITIQFLIESSFLTISGGTIGLVSGLLLANIIVYFLKIPFIIGIEYLILGFLVSSIVGISFGLYPARLASRITPIEALRYE
jgi:putative ABC transport system permease protein